MNNQVVKKGDQEVSTVKRLLNQESYKKRFDEILKEKSEGFMASIIKASNSTELKDAEPNSIISSAVVAATLDLPIDPNLGFSYLVPYSSSEKVGGKWIKTKKAQFQMGYKGFIQLALRSGQYKTINSIEVYKGEILKVNRLTGEIIFKEDTEDVDYSENNIIGYASYFKLINGFEKVLYMTKEQVDAHAKKYSQSYKYDISKGNKNSLWSTDFDTMAKKTVIKLLISKYGPLTIKMQDALINDQSELDSSSNEHIDTQIKEEIQEKANSEVIDVESFQEVEKDVAEDEIELPF